MRSEADIKAGITEGEKLVNEELQKLTKAIQEKNYIKAYQLTHDIAVSCIAISAVNDACFGED